VRTIDTAALVISVVALVLALILAIGGLGLQWLAYRATSDQARSIAGDVGQFRIDMHGLLGELRGMTERMMAAQERQFTKMLDAFVTRPWMLGEAGVRAEDSMKELQEFERLLRDLSESLRQQGASDEVMSRLERMESRLDDIQHSVAATGRLTAGVARRGPGRFMNVGVGTHWFEEAGAIFSPWVDAARKVGKAGHPLTAEEIGESLAPDLPGAVHAGLLSEEHRGTAEGTATVLYDLTEYGKHVLDSIERGLQEPPAQPPQQTRAADSS